MKENLVPLPLDTTTTPMFTKDAVPAAAVSAPAVERDDRDPVDAWVDEHPTNEFNEAEATGPVVTPPVPLEAEATEEPAAEEVAPVEAATAEATAPEAKPEAETKADVPAVAETPAEPRPAAPTYAPD